MQSELLTKRKSLSLQNGFIISNTGEEKTFLAMKEVEEILSHTEDDVIIVDVMHNFSKKEIEKLGGQIIEICPSVNSSSPVCINPLDADVWNNDDGYVYDKFDLFVTVFEKLSGASLTAYSRSFLDYALRTMYGDIRNSREKFIPVLSDLVDYLRPKDENGSKVLETLINKCDCFNHQTTLELEEHRLNSITLCDFGRFSEIGILFILEYIRSVIKHNHNNGKDTWVYICDFDFLFHETNRSGYIETLWKRGRMLGGIYTALILKDKPKLPMGLMRMYQGNTSVKYYDNDALSPLLYNSFYFVIAKPQTDDEIFVKNLDIKNVDEKLFNHEGKFHDSICIINNEIIPIN